MRTPPRSRQRYSTEAVHGSFYSGHVADRSSEAGVTPPTASRHISAVLPAPSPDRYLGRVGDTPEGCLPCAPCKRKPKQAPTYEGTTDIHQFLLQFEILSNYNQWDGETRGLELATSLSGDAREVLANLEPDDRQNYESLRLALINRFAPPGREARSAIQLYSRVCQSGENAVAFGHALRRLAHQAYRGAVDDQVLIGLYIRGLRDVGMRRHVHLSRPSTLTEAMSLASNFEVFEEGAGEGEGVSSNKPKKPFVKKVKAEQNNSKSDKVKPAEAQVSEVKIDDKKMLELEERLKNLESKPRAPRDYSKVVCWNCNQTGHTKWRCPHPPNDKQPPKDDQEPLN